MIAHCKDGLCNRMKAIASVVHTTDDYRIVWERIERSLNCDFDQLFHVPPFELLTAKQAKGQARYTGWRLLVHDDDLLPAGFDSLGDKLFGAIPLAGREPRGRNIDFEYRRIPTELRAAYSNIFTCFKPIEPIRSEIDRFAARFNPRTVSVHVRSWPDARARNELLFDSDAYIHAMRGCEADTNFYLTSDSPKVVARFQKIFGDRILVYPRRRQLGFRSRRQVEGMQDDLIELYLLSKNRRIIGTHISTFTEVAWWLGGASAEVSTPLPARLRAASSGISIADHHSIPPQQIRSKKCVDLRQPIHCAGLSVKRSGIEVVLYRSGHEELYVLNAAAHAIWTLCDGRHTVVDMERTIRAEFPVDDEHDLHREIHTTVDRLRTRGLVE